MPQGARSSGRATALLAQGACRRCPGVGAALTARRVARPGWRAPVPVVCCGNVTVGGAGKTTLVLDLARRLSGRDVHIYFCGAMVAGRGVPIVLRRMIPRTLVGDEALLLAQAAPTWIGADRAASAAAAVSGGGQGAVDG